MGFGGVLAYTGRQEAQEENCSQVRNYELDCRKFALQNVYQEGL